MEEHELALSDVHVQDSLQCARIQTAVSEKIKDYEVEVSEFRFHFPTPEVRGESPLSPASVDEDGDFVVKRRKIKDSETDIHYISIKHTSATRLKDVGLQVWSGALLLCDFILHNASPNSEWRNATCMELGAGVGLCSVLLSQITKKTFSTDIGKDVLKLCRENIEANNHRELKLVAADEINQTKSKADGTMNTNTDQKERFCVRELDWLAKDFRKDGTFAWTDQDVKALQDLDLIFAADVVYDDKLTDGLISTITRLCEVSKRNVTVYISVEKRLNFSLTDLDIACPAYEYFVTHLERLAKNEKEDCSLKYTTRKIETDFPQAFQYIRSKYLELWQITSKQNLSTAS